MNDHFNCLFILPQTRNENNQNYYTASKHFPVNTHFEYGHEAALNYIKHCSSEAYPSIIVFEESLGFEKNVAFIEEYRAQFYLFNIDTLLFSCDLNASNQQKEVKQYPAMISGTLPLPFNKQVFMKNVFPLLTVYMV